MAHSEPVSQVNPPLVAIVGATGTGKSDLALDLATSLIEGGQSVEIVNADAMQVYRGMNIGTAKVPESNRRGIPHHLFDVWDVTVEASVAGYQTLARAVILDIQRRGAIPLLVGGSGLYVSAVIYEFDFPGTDKDVRATLEARLETDGIEALQAELAQKDPLAAAAIDPRNTRRVIRALEVITLTGKPFGSGLDAEQRPWQDNLLILGLEVPRDELVTRLDQRVASMWDAGLVDEVKSLIPAGIESGVTASRAIGYQQALAYLSKTLTQEEAIEETQALTRRYARRQVSWFRRNTDTVWLDPREPKTLITALQLVTERLAS